MEKEEQPVEVTHLSIGGETPELELTIGGQTVRIVIEHEDADVVAAEIDPPFIVRSLIHDVAEDGNTEHTVVLHVQRPDDA